MNKIVAYILPLIAFVVLVVCREILEISNAIFLVLLLFIVISVPVFKGISKNKNSISK